MKTTTERFHFIDGDGPAGRACDVTLTMQVTETPGIFRAEWQAKDIPANVKQFILDYATRELEKYVVAHPELGIHVIINAVGVDPIRQNEYDRATINAMRMATYSLKLPDILRYARPTPEELQM